MGKLPGDFVSSNRDMFANITKEEDAVCRIASYYDDFEAALNIIKELCKDIVEFDIHDYCQKQRICYKKRISNNVGHNIYLLDNDLRSYHYCHRYILLSPLPTYQHPYYENIFTGGWRVSEQPEYDGSNDDYGSDSIEGVLQRDLVMCHHCFGSGEVVCSDCEGNGQKDEYTSCFTCNGTGGKSECVVCNGTGELRR